MHLGSVTVYHASWLEWSFGVRDRGIRKGCGFAIHVDRVNSEAVDTAAQPKLYGRIVNGLTSNGVLPVEIGLFFCEEVEIVLARLLIPFPCAASAKVITPVIRRQPLAAGGVLSWTPDIPISLWAVFAGMGLLKLCMLI